MSKIQEAIVETNERIRGIESDITVREAAVHSLKSRKALLESALNSLIEVQQSLDAVDGPTYNPDHDDTQELDATVVISQD